MLKFFVEMSSVNKDKREVKVIFYIDKNKTFLNYTL